MNNVFKEALAPFAPKEAPRERREFEMSEDQLKELMEACRPVIAIMLQCGTPRSPQENANMAWCALGDKLGFDGMSVEPAHGKGTRFFTAIADATGGAK